MLHEGTSSLLEQDRPSRFGTWLGRGLALAYRIAGKHRYDEWKLEHLGDCTIMVMPSIANPKALRTGAFMARELESWARIRAASVLDLGTGSGICAIVAAKRARSVVATDINPAAARCARINALINGVENRIEIRTGDLFEPVSDSSFDLILFNPPFLLGQPKDARDAAWRSHDLARRFSMELADRLAPGGEALLCLSTFGDACPHFESELIAAGFSLTVHARQRMLNETITLLRVIPCGQPVGPALPAERSA